MSRIWCLAVIVVVATLPNEVVAGDAEDVKTLQQAGLEADGRSLLRYLRARMLTREDRDQVEQLIRQLGDESFAARERASAALAGHGVASVNLLRRATTDPDAEIARRAERCLREIEKVPSPSVASAAVRQIGKLKPEGAADVLLGFFPNADDPLTADEVRAALAKVVMPAGVPDPAALKALDNSAPLIRGAAGEALIRAGYHDARRLMSDADPVVRLRVLLAVVTHEHDKSALEPLIGLLDELPPGEAWLIEDLLNRLAGDSAPAVGLGQDADSRRRCRDAWVAWWRGAASGIDLTRIDGASSLKGITLMVQVDARPITGRVYEVNGAGEILWKIENLQMPTDAVKVGSDRVLIAEYTLQRVSLRELNGTTVWTVQCTMPQTLQALPNGHFLIATRSHVSEYDGKQKEVFNLARIQADVVSAVKDRNGHYIVLTRSGVCLCFDGQKNELRRFNADPPGSFGGLQVLTNGNIVIAHANGLSEFDAEGRRKAWSVKMHGQFTSVQRLPNGHTIATSLTQRRMIEYSREGKEVAEIRPVEGGSPRRAHRR